MNSLLQQTIFLCNQNHTLAEHQLKFLLISLATKLQQMDKTIPKIQSKIKQSTLTPQHKQNSQIIDKIQVKIMEIDQRRKMWDATMSEIFSQKQRTNKQLKSKINKVQQIQAALQQIKQVQKSMQQKIYSADNDKNTIKLIVMDKIQKTKNQFANQLQQKYNKLKKQLQDEYRKKISNQMKIQVYCNELSNKNKKINDLDDIENHNNIQYVQMDKIQDMENQDIPYKVQNHQKNQNNQKQKLKNCNNLQVLIQNINAVMELKNEITDNNQVIQRFQMKLGSLGSKIQVIQNKLADLFGDERSVYREKQENKIKEQPKIFNQPEKSKAQINNFKKFQQVPRQAPPPRIEQPLVDINLSVNKSAKNFNKFLMQGRTLTYLNKNMDISCVLFGSIPMRKKNKFSIQIITSSKNYISVGIADQKYNKLQDVWDQQNFIMMRSFKGQVYCGPSTKVRQTGAIFVQGDKVTVEMNFIQHKISWFINQNLRAVYKSNKLGQQYNYVNWVPIVRFFNAYDSIKWL